MVNREENYLLVGMSMFVIGAALGTVIGLLAAPQSGRRTRRMLHRKAEDARDYLTDLGEQVSEKGQEIHELAKTLSPGEVLEHQR